MTSAPPRALAFADTILALLNAVEHLNVYDNDVADTPPADPDGKTHPYAVLWSGPGTAQSTRLCGDPNQLAWGFQVTCAGGDRTRCLWAVDKVRAALTGVRVPDGRGWRLTEVVDEARVLPDRDVTPPRFYVPLVYALPAEAAPTQEEP